VSRRYQLTLLVLALAVGLWSGAAGPGYCCFGSSTAEAPLLRLGVSGFQTPKHPTFDHSLLGQILRAHVRNGKVDYQQLRARDQAKLKRYLDSLAAADSGRLRERDDELAFWLNAYNACVIAGVIERYPGTKSVQDVKGFFEDRRWLVAGRKRSLNEIENQIIRPRFKDPRIHFILVCAAQSCPPLQSYAMSGETLRRDLERVTRQVVNDDRFVRIDPKAGRLRLTRILSWYRKDFEQKHGSLEAFLRRYLEPAKVRQLERGNYTIEFMPYYWGLNDAPSATTSSAR